MPQYKVRKYSDAGVPDAELLDVEAPSEKEAAEKVCGVPLTAGPRAAMYMRADVRRLKNMDIHHEFYAID